MATSATHTGVDYLRFTRPSRSGRAPHQVLVDGPTLRPISCSCAAGVHDTVCWAALQVAIDELVPIALARWAQACGFLELEQAAAVYGQALRRRAAAAHVVAERAQRDVEACPMRDPDAPIAYTVVKPEPEDIVA